MDNEEFNKINIINKKEFDINKTNYQPLLINKKINLQNENKSIFYLNIKNKIIDNNIKDIIQNLFKLLTICLLIIYYYIVLNKAKKKYFKKTKFRLFRSDFYNIWKRNETNNIRTIANSA